MYKKAVASFWTVEEVDLSEDMRSWVGLRGEMMPMGLFECWTTPIAMAIVACSYVPMMLDTTLQRA